MNRINTVLITGGAGFIGSAVIRMLLESTSLRIINLDKLTYAGNLSNIPQSESSNRYYFEHADICDRSVLKSILRTYRPDAIMHLAAESHVDRSISGPAAFLETNVVGTYALLEETRLYWEALEGDHKSVFRFHHISTDEVFGDLADSPEGTGSPFSEESRYRPSNPYSATKAGADHLVLSWHRTFGLPVLISNCSNNYGPYQYPEKLIPLTIRKALAGQPIPLYGSGKQIRDWLFVEDHAKALYRVLTQGKVGETYNIGGSNELTNLQVVHAVCNELEALSPQRMPKDITKYQDLIKLVPDRPGHDQHYAIDSSKIKKELAWFPKESFQSGLRKTIEWYLCNQDWIKQSCNLETKSK